MKASIHTRPAILLGTAALLFVGTGCATKKHVRGVVAPVENRVGSVEKRTAEQAAALGEVENNVSRVDERAMEADRKAVQAGQAAQQANQAAQQADQRAQTAQTRADSAQQMADQTRGRLADVVGNLDNFQHVTTESVFFAINRWRLTDEAMQSLDEAVAKLQGNNNFVLEIQGFTDRTGNAQSNLELSRKRADSVVRYLTTKHNMPLRRIHVLGLGVDEGDNSTREARQQNRRVDINVFARAIDNTGTPSTSTTNQGAAATQR